MQYLKKVLLPNSRTGSTLFEVCLVIGLMGLSLYPIVLSFSFMKRSTVLHELNRLHSFVKFLQQKALLDQNVYVVTFDKEQVISSGETVWSFAAGVRIGFPKVVSGSPVKGPPGNPVRDLELACTWPKNSLVIYPTGIMTSGSLYLTDEKMSCLYALTVDASEITSLRRYFYDAKWHRIEG